MIQQTETQKRTDQEAFRDAVEVCLKEATATKKKYYVFYPYIANINLPSLCHLVVPLSVYDALEPGEESFVALTVFPNGDIRQGKH